MDKEKHIEEMGKILCRMKNGCDGCTWDKVYCNERSYAEEIYNAGYRKQNVIAEEMINVALSKIQIMINSIKAQEEIGNISEFNGGAKTALEVVFKDLAELKKKYTEEGK